MELNKDRIILPFILHHVTNVEKSVQLSVLGECWIFDFYARHGAPAHFAIVVSEWLKDHFPGLLRGPYEWLAKSPNFTPCGFSLRVGSRKKSTVTKQRKLWRNSWAAWATCSEFRCPIKIKPSALFFCISNVRREGRRLRGFSQKRLCFLAIHKWFGKIIIAWNNMYSFQTLWGRICPDKTDWL